MMLAGEHKAITRNMHDRISALASLPPPANDFQLWGWGFVVSVRNGQRDDLSPMFSGWFHAASSSRCEANRHPAGAMLHFRVERFHLWLAGNQRRGKG